MNTKAVSAFLAGLAVSLACSDALGQGSISDVLKRKADQLLRDGIRSAPLPQTAPQSPVTATASPSLSGTWQSRHGMVYQLSQQGNSFTWTAQAWGATQTAQGTVTTSDGRDLQVTWSPPTPGSATGRVVRTDSQNNALEIQWSNGAVFFRESPLAGGTVAIAPPNLSGKWNSSLGLVYQLSQQGTSFTWTTEAWGAIQTAQGSIGARDGRDLQATWSPPTPGSATGRIVRTDSQNNALEIQWSNAVVFYRETPTQSACKAVGTIPVTADRCTAPPTAVRIESPSCVQRWATHYFRCLGPPNFAQSSAFIDQFERGALTAEKWIDGLTTIGGLLSDVFGPNDALKAAEILYDTNGAVLTLIPTEDPISEIGIEAVNTVRNGIKGAIVYSVRGTASDPYFEMLSLANKVAALWNTQRIIRERNTLTLTREYLRQLYMYGGDQSRLAEAYGLPRLASMQEIVAAVNNREFGYVANPVSFNSYSPAKTEQAIVGWTRAIAGLAVQAAARP